MKSIDSTKKRKSKKQLEKFECRGANKEKVNGQDEPNQVKYNCNLNKREKKF
tara:strand:- start:558 stop:713 length:156 start_codon:yes stop_codon:yes gene_type:complete